jgi:hypothetical protein
MGNLSVRWVKKCREQASALLPALIGIDEFQPAIPWRVGLHQSLPPLHRPASECDKLSLPVNQHWEDGHFAAPVNFNRLPKPPAA